MIDVSEQIEGLVIEPLQQFHDHRGTLMHILQKDTPGFEQFGEVYCSTVKPGRIKAWRRRKETTQHFAVPIGRIQLVIYDDRPGSETENEMLDIITGSDQYVLIKIPPMVWFGFQGLEPSEALLVTCCDKLYDPSDIDRLDFSDPYIPHEWQR